MRGALLTALALLAFAANSLLCRAALAASTISPTDFTVLRLVSGAVVLAGIVRVPAVARRTGRGNWPSAVALLAYAVCFSFAYVSLSTGTGALLLFSAVQATMIGAGLMRGERFRGGQLVGLGLAGGGLVGLLLPGLTAPAPLGAALMLAAGVAWGIYSLRGRGSGDATLVTAGNFLRAAVLIAPLGLLTLVGDTGVPPQPAGVAYAVASGAIASAVGYVIWYTALPALSATVAATVQLSVPAIAAFGGVLLLGEPLTGRLVIASIAILGGLALVSRTGRDQEQRA